MVASISNSRPKALIWFRNDLRVADNTALWNAAQQYQLTALFIVTPEQWQKHDMAPIKVDLIRRNLIQLSKALADLNIPLKLETCPLFKSVPSCLVEVAKSIQAQRVFWNREYLVNENERDNATQAELSRAGIESHSFEDSLITPPASVLTGDEQMYKVFTPFYNNWSEQTKSFPPELLALPEAQPKTNAEPDCVDDFFKDLDMVDSSHWLAGEEAALNNLADFTRERVAKYQKERDIPILSATSQMSLHLSVGTVSARQCLLQAKKSDHSEPWIRQLAWRDFYNHLVSAYPDLVKGKPFQAKTKSIAWRDSESDFQAWTEGKTGQPFVDAGMRQLKQTGWMHNRLRMVTAMFLTKNLFIDWHKGEKYFMQNLVDGDFALNNGGWQWSASTGTDAAPYFRIFNPFSQSKRFDSDGSFIKEYVPELKDVPVSALQDPIKLENQKPENYPSLIVDLKQSRKYAIETFSKI